MKMLSLVSFILVTALLPLQSRAGDRLLFEQGGPSDGTIAPFTIAIGVPGKIAREIISGAPGEFMSSFPLETLYVSAETYERVRAVIVRSDFPEAEPSDNIFSVIEFNGNTPLFTVFVPDEVVVQVMGDIGSTLKANHQTVPPLITTIMRKFPRPKYRFNP
ncbi:MAG: hypothetical protein LBE22_12390 [Azoarcus sp.]|nr:hypothetical protein [Azoarcus sp.]